MTLEQAFDIKLPKWPCCIIYGDQLTEEQALEIIRRTDSFFNYQCGNNRDFIEKATKILHIPQFPRDPKPEDWDNYHKADSKWKEKWGFINLEYLSNNWISSPFIGGPYGWCNPSGKIALRQNIGKWPTVEEVYEELCTLAKAFPFLSLSCIILDGGVDEYSSNVAVAFKTHKGEVSILEGVSKEEALTKCNLKNPYENINLYSLFNTSRENYLPLSQLEKWYNQIFNKGRSEIKNDII